MSRPGDDVRSGQLFEALPAALDAEQFVTLAETGGVRIERIVSTGHVTTSGTWYDQAWDEWVLVLRGAALLHIENEAAPRRLAPGDWLFLPAHVRHRVTWTTPDEPTVWLAVHVEAQAGGEQAAR